MSHVIFRANFDRLGEEWATRHTPNPDQPAHDRCVSVNKAGQLVMRIKPVYDIGVDNIRRVRPEVNTAHIATKQAFGPGHRFRARMKFPSGKGAHSAFWLQDEVPNQIGGSEVDIAEHFGSDETTWSNVYWRTPETMWPKEPTRWRQNIKHDPRGWNVYGLDWHADQYVFTLNGQRTHVCWLGTSVMPKVLILSLLVSDWEEPRLDRSHLERYRTLVDWVKVTKL